MVVKKLLIVLVFLLGVMFVFLKYQGGVSKTPETPVPVTQSSTEKSEVRSADGTVKLVMTARKNENSISIYTFSVIEESGKKTPLFEKNAVLGETMSLPLNSWSPNNKYLFIENRIGNRVDYLVFKANAVSFLNAQPYLNATALFNQKVRDYNLKTITGWDDPVLMSVLTVKGPRFWFDITTQSFIQLAR